VGHVLATQCLLQTPSKTYAIRVNGTLKSGVSAKDIILAVIAKIGIGGGTGCVFEYLGSTIRGLSIEERMTICNMSIEGGESKKLGKGDVLIIPAGTAHWINHVDQAMELIIIHLPQPASAQ